MFLNSLWQWTYERVPKTPEICRKVLLSYFFIILGQIELEKVIFNHIWHFRTAWLHVTCELRVLRINRENLPLPIQIQYLKNQKSFAAFFFCIFGINIKFPIFWKVIEPHRSSISAVSDSKRCVYLNASKGLYLKTL